MEAAHHHFADDAVIDVMEAEYLPPYSIRLGFSDGAEQIVDFRKFLEKSRHPEIRKYLNQELFRKFPSFMVDWTGMIMICAFLCKI